MGELRRYVLQRDRLECLAAKMDKSHRCMGPYADRPWIPEFDLTLQHVTMVHSHLDVRRSDERHCVTLCHRLNGGGDAPSKELAEYTRSYLRDRYPDCQTVDSMR